MTAVDALKHPYFDGIREEDYMKKLLSPSVTQNRIISACETVYDKKSSLYNNFE